MSQTVSDVLLKRLREWDVEKIFSYPGDGINGTLEAFGKQDGLQYVQSRHEEMSAFEAVGYAKFTGPWRPRRHGAGGCWPTSCGWWPSCR